MLRDSKGLRVFVMQGCASWLHMFLGWEGSPAKIDYRKKGALILTSLLEDLFATFCEKKYRSLISWEFPFHPLKVEKGNYPQSNTLQTTPPIFPNLCPSRPLPFIGHR